MAAGETETMTAVEPPIDPSTAEEAAARAVQKRYEGLALVKNKAVKGKGAWYWSHLEPLLLHNSDTELPKSVKLRCLLCSSLFSASNPSRTASEHLKRGTCPNFNSHRKRPSSAADNDNDDNPSPSPLSVIDPSRYYHEIPPLISPSLQQQRSLQENVKKLKSPKSTPVIQTLTKSQIEFALNCLSDWVYESSGAVSLSSLHHPKFRSFLTHIGIPPLSTTQLSGPKLESKFQQAKNESEARIKDAMFFQLSSDGWNKKQTNNDDHFITLTVNLPNGTSVFRRAVLTGSGQVPSGYAEEVLWEAVSEICVQSCVGIVGDRFKNKALRSLESQHPWMVNLSCQCQGLISLIKDFYKELPLFKNVVECCRRLASFVNNETRVRGCFRRHQLSEYGCASLFRVPRVMEFESGFELVEDVIGSVRALRCLVLDELYKMVSFEDPEARELGEMVRTVGFWNDLDAVCSLVRLIKETAREIEAERPLVGQCIPLWEELRAKVKNWCAKFRVSEGVVVDKIFERRMKKNYHPAWAVAYILDPLYLIRDPSGKYLPPFKHLTPQQERDVDKLITRLVPREEAHIVLMELMKWRSEGLDPVYARAVQMKERDPATGKMKVANPQSSRLVWETYLTEFKSLRKVAVRLIFLHATSRGFKCSLSLMRWVQGVGRSRAGMDKAQKMIFIAAHSKLKKRELSSEDEKDDELFADAPANVEGDVLNEVFADASSI